MSGLGLQFLFWLLPHTIVYADENETGITTVNGQAIADKYDTYIHNQITDAFGGIEDVDKNGRVIFLMLDIVDGYMPPGGYVAGYFQSLHMYQRSTGAPYDKSNEADMLFMDTDPGFDDTNADMMQNFYSTMAHELQHLIEFSQTAAKGKGEKDIWINEGLSTGAEYIYGNGTGSPAQQTSRITWFNNDPIGSIAYGNNFFVWNGYWELGTSIPETSNQQDTLANYSTAYLFFQWLRIHASNGTGIYKEIIASPYADYRAVTYPANSRTSIISSSTDWAKLLSSWMIANARVDSSGVYGYKGVISPTVRGFDIGRTPFTNYFWNEFAPGEGIYSNLAGYQVTAGNVAGGGPNIRYVGILYTGTPDTTAPYTGSLLLTYNANTNNTSYSYEDGLVSNYQNSGSNGNSNMLLSVNGGAAPASAAPLPTTYPIDVHFGPDGTVSQDSPRAGIDRPRASAKPHGIGKWAD